MLEHFWFVIEGDNGVGKDTLADRLVIDGWFLASQTSQALCYKDEASHLGGLNRVIAFLSYNRFCAKLASGYQSRSFLVRYWPSTLIAGFADAIFDWDEFENRVRDCVTQLPIPRMILFLTCRLDARRDRVRERGLVPGSVDNISEDRDARYLKAVTWLTTHMGEGYWHTPDTTELNSEQVYVSVKSLLAKLRGSA
jgi:hypothetical protein